MRQLQLTCDSLAENLALDEALLDAAEAGETDAGILRLWESPEYAVVLGRSSRVETEVQLAACRAEGIPVLRRSSGGGTIVAGPGCLMYAVVLDFATYPQLQAIDTAHCFVLSQLARMLTPLVKEIEVAGISDLVIQGDLVIQSNPPRKFSGNAMRRKRNHILYHGTLLYDFDLERIPRWLASPTRTPAYRHDRRHAEFVANLPLARQALVDALLEGWRADQVLPCWPELRTTQLVQTKYQRDPQWVLHTPTP